MSERLPDGMNYVDDSGDVLPIDRSVGPYVTPTYDGEYRGVADAAKRVMDGVQETKEEVSPKERVRRQQGLLDNYGFIADSLEELSRATALTMDDTFKIGGAAKYVMTIQLHQEHKSKAEDPRAAARSVTATIGGFAKKPLRDVSFLNQLSGMLDGRHARPPEKILEAVPMLADWRNDSGTQRALVDILRSVEIRASIDNHTEDRTSEELYKESPDLINRVNRLLEQHHIRELRRFIETRIEQHHNQAAFWYEKLQEIEAHTTGDVRQIATRAMADIDELL